MQPHPSHPADQAVGDPGGKFALESGVLALMAPATHEVIPLSQFGQQHGDVGRIVLQISIEADDHLSASHIKPSRHGCGLAIVLAQQHSHHFGHFGAELGQHVRGAVAGSVVDQNQLKRLVGWTQC